MNQFVQYPYQIERADNGGYVVTALSMSPADSATLVAGVPSGPQRYAKYAFANLADLTYWIGFNEQKPA